jgi:hypothetical protein
MKQDGKDANMHNQKRSDNGILVQSLWSAIFHGTRLRHICDDDQRVFLLKTINWRKQETKVVDAATGEIFRFPWNELEFVDDIEANLPGWPPAPKIV